MAYQDPQTPDGMGGLRAAQDHWKSILLFAWMMGVAILYTTTIAQSRWGRLTWIWETLKRSVNL